MMAEAAPFISVPEKGKRNVANTAMVINSLASTLPLVIPDANISIEDSKSAPNSPEREEVKKSKGFLKKHLPRPRSPHHRRTSQSDPESSASRSPSTSPQPRPRWLPFRSKKKKSSGQNGELSTIEKACVSVTDMISGSMSSLDLEATPVHRLPGGSSEEDNILVSSSNSVPEVCDVSLFSSSTEGDGQATVEGFDRNTTVPEIRVSDERNENVAEYTLQEAAGVDVPNRKNSQSSRGSSGSGLLSIGTSGLGSLLSPSGDECYSGSGSDIESPLSPYSGASSFTSETPGELSDSDPIERDYDPQESKDPVTTPIPGQGDDNSPTSGEGKELRERRKKKDSKPNTVWMKVRNAVKAWSPFAVQFKKKYYPWVQLAGHEGNFMPGGENGTIMKKSDPKERNALRALMNDPLRDFVPEYKGEVEQETGTYVEMTDLLRDFNEPAVMDIKMGIRTYLEEEIAKKHILRADMYQKMVDVDPNEPTPEEHAQAAISKPRYMQWRETLSSTSTLGFRIEGIKTLDGKALKNFKKTKRREDVLKALAAYVAENPSVKDTFCQRLLDIRETLRSSNFFRTHELIGSSLLFVYDASGLASIHMIDFGKTTPIPEGITIDHTTEWVEGNHEDGYLFGLNNLIDIWKEI